VGRRTAPTCRADGRVRLHPASLRVAGGIPPLHLSRFMGHAKVTTTLTIYIPLFADDYAETMVALGAMAAQKPTPSYGGNVVPLHG
jgi:hypothetical protein